MLFEEAVVSQMKWFVLVPTVRRRQTLTQTQLPDFQPSVPSLEIKLLISPFPSSDCPILLLLFTVTIPTLGLDSLYCVFTLPAFSTGPAR